MSAISSSLSVIWGTVSHDGKSAVGTAVAADAPPASDKDMPTAPTTGTASFRRFRFEARFVCGIIEVLPCLWLPVTLFVRFAQTTYKIERRSARAAQRENPATVGARGGVKSAARL